MTPEEQAAADALKAEQDLAAKTANTGKSKEQVSTDEEEDEELKEGLQDVKALQSELKRARQEAAKYRNERKTDKAAMDALRVKVAQTLGIDAEDASPDKLAKDLSEARSELRKERLTNKFHTIATSLDADPELALAYMQYKGLLADLDPAEDDFASELESRIKTALKANAKLKATQTGTKSGSEFGKDGSAKKQQPTMNDYLRRAAGM